MNNKTFLSKNNYFRHGLSGYGSVVAAVVLAVGVVGLTSCGRKSQAKEDEANLKLVGYELDQGSFFKAVENDDVQALKIFKDRTFDFNQQDLKGRSAVHVAAESGSVKALDFLAKNGADIEAVDEKGVSPLMVAARVGNADVITALLKSGASAKRKDKVGKFALIHAMDGGSSEAIHLLAAQSRKMLDTGLLYAADMDKYESIPELVKYGASVYARNNGKTGLMIAAERGNVNAAEILLAEGANLYAVSDDGRLAKEFAEGNDKVLAVLLRSEAGENTKSLALDWSEDELEALVQKAMERSANEPEGGETTSTATDNKEVVVQRIKGKNLSMELSNSVVVKEKVTMAAYAEKSLPIRVSANDSGRVEIYDVREVQSAQIKDPVVKAGSQIGMTGLRVKQVTKKVVNNKHTGGRDEELVTLMIEDEKSGLLRELYAGYESQAAEAVAVLKLNDTGEHLVVERGDEFYDLKGTGYKVTDVNDEEVIIENVDSGELTMLPLMGVKN